MAGRGPRPGRVRRRCWRTTAFDSPSSRPSGSCRRSPTRSRTWQRSWPSALRPARLQSVGPVRRQPRRRRRRARARSPTGSPSGASTSSSSRCPSPTCRRPADAAAIIERADRPNLSMCMDVWHLYRMGLSLYHLDGLWPYISTVQFNDGTIVSEFPDDLREDCLLNRRVPGRGRVRPRRASSASATRIGRTPPSRSRSSHRTSAAGLRHHGQADRRRASRPCSLPVADALAARRKRNS